MREQDRAKGGDDRELGEEMQGERYRKRDNIIL